MPVEFKVTVCGVRFVFLNSITDISENFGFGGIVNFGMILNLIDGSETKISRSNSFLGSRWKLDDWDVESSGCFFKNFEGSLLLGLHGEFNFLIILLNSFKFKNLIILLRIWHSLPRKGTKTQF